MSAERYIELKKVVSSMPGRGHHVKSALVLYRESLGQEDTQPVAKGSKKKTGVSKVSNKKLGSKETKAKFLKLSNQEQQQFFSAERAARDLSEQQLIVRSEYGSTHGLVDSDGRGGSTYTATQLDTAVFNARDSVVDTASVYESLLADENLPRTFAAGEGQIALRALTAGMSSADCIAATGFTLGTIVREVAAKRGSGAETIQSEKNRIEATYTKKYKSYTLFKKLFARVSSGINTTSDAHVKLLRVEVYTSGRKEFVPFYFDSIERGDCKRP